jgi:type IV pilus assembly protein PilQ
MKKNNFFKIAILSSFIANVYANEDINTLQNISYNDNGNKFRIVLDFANPQNMSSVKINPSGENLLLHVDNVSYKLFNDSFDTNSKIVKNIKINEKDKDLEMIISLSEMQPYNVKAIDNKIEITIDKDRGIKQPKSTENIIKESVSDTIINDIDFERINENQAKVKIEYTTKNALFETLEKEDHLELTFPKAKLISDLFRKLDVKEFNTPIEYIISKVDPERNVVVVKVYFKEKIKVKTSFEQNQRSIEVLVEEKDYAKKMEKLEFSGEKMSFNFQDIPVRNVLQIIGQKMGINLVISDNVSGNITLQLEDVPYDQALDIILKTKDLDKRVNGNVMLISTFEDLVTRESKELKSKEDLKTLAPVEQETVQIKYAKAKQITDVIKNFSTPKGSIVFDERTNKLIISDTRDRIEDLKKKIETLDIPVRQVVIESRIVFAKTNIQEELGVRWGMGYNQLDSSKQNLIVGGGNSEGLNDVIENVNNQAKGEGTINPPSSSIINMPVNGATSGLALGFLNDTISLDVELSALEKNGDIEIVARPKVITADQKSATIESGKEYPYLELSDSGNSGVSFKEILLSLGVTPQITPNNKILLDLKINQDSVAEITESGPAIDSTKIETQVLSNNGETIVLGGIFKSDVIAEEEKTPLLGDIPYLGRLFKKTVNKDERSELIIFITPKIVESEIIPSE